ncbi:hypothetical protein H311_00804, partial [Anncaliia algerae PRA109]
TSLLKSTQNLDDPFFLRANTIGLSQFDLLDSIIFLFSKSKSSASKSSLSLIDLNGRSHDTISPWPVFISYSNGKTAFVFSSFSTVSFDINLHLPYHFSQH